MHLQSWTKLVDRITISACISQFFFMETTTRLLKWFPCLAPLTQCCLKGRRIHQGFFGGKATLIRGRGGDICCGKWFSRSKFSFILKCLNSFVQDCSFQMESTPIQCIATFLPTPSLDMSFCIPVSCQ